MSNKKISIEVGTNTGTDTWRLMGGDNYVVYCFEPTKELVSGLWSKFKNDKNVIVLPFAIDTKNDFVTFNVAGTGDWGCSSLNKFDRDIAKKWPGRPDFVFTNSYVVPTITLYDFIVLYNIPYVDFLWIDAQGHDFNVLKSLKDKIDIVKEGRCEAAYNINLYEDINNSHKDIIEYLRSKGFETSFELDQSGIGAECNITFKKNVK